MTEIHDFALIVLIVAGGLSLAVLMTRFSDRVPIPAPVMLLVAAALISDVLPALRMPWASATSSASRVVALIVILLNGGWISAGGASARAPGGHRLGILGTFVTAAVLAAAAHCLLGLAGRSPACSAPRWRRPTLPSCSPCSAAARSAGARGTMLEGEAGFNDPAGIALMLGMIELATHADASFMVVIQDFAVEMGIGRRSASSARASSAAPVRARRARSASRCSRGVLYGVTALTGGSGFLAVFIAGLLLGDAERLRERDRRFKRPSPAPARSSSSSRSG